MAADNRETEGVYRAIAEQIRGALLDREQVAGLRALLDERDRQLDVLAEERRTMESSSGSPSTRRRVGEGWLEVKWIPRNSGKLSGPYLYYRVREGGHLRSRYIGKASP